MALKNVLDFLALLNKNNNREWFAQNKPVFQAVEPEARSLFTNVYEQLQKTDSLEKMQVFRIYRDVRFSKDKSPYKKYLSAWFTRTKPFLRGSYYLHIEPGGSFAEGGFWEPSAQDLLRIRKELELDASPMKSILNDKSFQEYFTGLEGNGLKTAPKGFDKIHPDMEFIRKKQFLIVRRFTDKDVLDKDFDREVIKTFEAMRPFFDYMSEVLTTNLNGESIAGQ